MSQLKSEASVSRDAFIPKEFMCEERNIYIRHGFESRKWYIVATAWWGLLEYKWIGSKWRAAGITDGKLFDTPHDAMAEVLLLDLRGEK